MISASLFSQQGDYFQIATNHLNQNKEKWNLTELDLQNPAISSSYKSKINGVTHYYLIQRVNGIEVYNAISNVHINKDGKVFYAQSRFVSDAQSKVATTSPAINPEQAVKRVAKELGYASFAPKAISSDRTSQSYTFEKSYAALEDIKAELKYFLTENEELRLVWDVDFDAATGDDYASMRIDAVSGELLDRKSYTVSCQFETGMYHRHSDICFTENGIEVTKALTFGSSKTQTAANQILSNGPQYNVFPFPAESPGHGQREFVTDDYNLEASPYGWHDVNGQPGPEYTFTRGNNVWAWPARAGNMTSQGGEPDGGSELIFDFDFDPTKEPQDYIDAATVNLFYSNNMLHDFTYAYGFDEESGNFQANNYGKGGRQGDAVNALAQFGANAGQNINNADFSTPADGGSGRMRMFVWNSRQQSVMKVLEPEIIARNYTTGTADFGPVVDATPINGVVAIARDGSGNPTLGCNAIINEEDVAGKVAMVDRGSCFFIQKTYNVQQAGAIACIICNFENSVINMGAGEGIPNPDIPTVMLSSADCNFLRQSMLIGDEVVVSFVNELADGPTQLDGTLDNGIVGHELGHGVSNRLTGGPLAAGCLGNSEQMGEGWSDFFTLVMSVKEGDTGPQPRGIGTYVLNQNNNGQGIRRFPYSTDLSVSPITYDDIIGTEAPHPVGEVWVAMLWEMYWAMVDKYGFDPDINNQESGNSRAIRLVMDGMRYQPCGPGFVDGRDAILAADELLYDGENQCLIWEAFAKRGLGFSADQGSPNNRNDGLEGYDVSPQCLGRLDVVKTMTPTIAPGDEVDVTLEVGNHTGSASNNVVITEDLPDGLSFVMGSASVPASVQGNQLTLEVGNMSTHETRNVTYKLISDESKFSNRSFYDDMEDPEREFDWDFITVSGATIWEYSTDLPYEGDYSWAIRNSADLDQGMYNFDPITLPNDNPILRFFHNYETSPGAAGGIVEVSNNGGATWQVVESEIIRSGYRGKISYNAFTLPNLRAFWGNSNGWRETIIDLSEFAGQEVHIKFRYGTAGETVSRPLAWSIDNIEIMTPLFYNNEICISADGVDSYCTVAKDGGTLVEAGLSTSTSMTTSGVECKMFPNPANNQVQLQMNGLQNSPVSVSVYSTDGRLIYFTEDKNPSTSINWSIPTMNFTPGLHLFRIQTNNDVLVKKILIQH